MYGKVKEKSARKRSEKAVSNQELEELYAKLRSYCYSLSRNKWDGEDLTQEAIYRALHQYRHQSEWRASLLKKIAHNLWVDQLRKRNRKMITEDLGADKTCTDHHGHSFEAVEELVSKLTPKQLVAFSLKEAFQFKIKEIAEQLNMTEPAVKGLLNRTRSKLSKNEHDKESVSVESYWPEHMQEEAVTVLYRSIEEEDPALLLEKIPELLSQSEVPKMVFQKKEIHSYSSPSSCLSIAA